MWNLESNKPEPYKTVLLRLIGDDFTTGWWADKAGHWVGLALNQSPPTYQLEDACVTHWQSIEPPNTGLQSDLPIGVPEFPCPAREGSVYHFPGCPHRQTAKA